MDEFDNCPYGFCDLPDQISHDYCKHMRERLDSVSGKDNWIEDFKERWTFWEILKPFTKVGDTQSNRLLMVTGWKV